MNTFVDVTSQWDTDAGAAPQAWPYHTARWGAMVAEVFGGEFRVLRHTHEPAVHVPLLIGGALAPDGFASGPIGYGGAVAIGRTEPIPLRAQHVIAARVEISLGVTCRRWVTAPSTRDDSAAGAVRETILVDLTGGMDAIWFAYDGSVRTAIRKCVRSRLRTETLGAGDTAAVIELIHRTQGQVGASYRVPEELVHKLLRHPDFCLAVGCRLGDDLVSVGIFLRAYGRVAYLYNGWDHEHASLGANYLMLHQAIRACCAQGDQVIDMGYSHRPALRAFKQRWGGVAASVAMITRPRRGKGNS